MPSEKKSRSSDSWMVVYRYVQHVMQEFSARLALCVSYVVHLHVKAVSNVFSSWIIYLSHSLIFVCHADMNTVSTWHQLQERSRLDSHHLEYFASWQAIYKSFAQLYEDNLIDKNVEKLVKQLWLVSSLQCFLPEKLCLQHFVQILWTSYFSEHTPRKCMPQGYKSIKYFRVYLIEISCWIEKDSWGHYYQPWCKEQNVSQITRE